jgi:uncharacterized protein (DUF433 family)
MSLTLQADPLPLRLEEETGAIRVGDSRIFLERIVGDFERGISPEAIVHALDTLQLADVYAVIAYYLRHTEEVKNYIRRRDEEAEELRRKIEAIQPPRPHFWEELRARKARMESGDASAVH